MSAPAEEYGFKGTPEKVSKKDLLKRYRTRLQSATKFRENEGYDELWRRLIDMYRGKVFKTDMTDEDRILVNVAFSTINVIAPSIAVNHPKITINATKPEWDAQAVIAEAVINYWWRHYDYKVEFRRAVDDFLQVGHGWLKIGYRYQEQEVDLTPQERQDQISRSDAEINQAVAENPEMAADLPSPQDMYDNLPETKWECIEDRPFVERVSPFDMYIDPEATSMGDAKWVAQRVVRDWEDVKRDRRYKNRTKVKPDAGLNPRWRDENPTRQRPSRQYEDDIKRCTIWEFYDIAKGTVSVFSESGDGAFLVDPQPMPYSYGIPFVQIRNYNVPEYFYPLGDLEALESLQSELNKTRTQMMNHRKRYARKYLTKTNYFTPEALKSLVSDNDGEVISIEDDVPLESIVAPLPQEKLDPQMYQYSEQIEADMDRVTGVNEYQRGSLPEQKRTATEASIIQDAANARSADKLSIIETALAGIARRLLQLAQAYMTGTQTARIAGKNGANLWVPFRRDDITGEFDFEIEAGSTQPQNDSFRVQQAMQMLSALSPFAGVPGMPGAVVNAL